MKVHSMKLLLSVLLVSSLAPAAGLAAAEERAQALAREYGCISCHGMVRKQVGPGFAQIAARYRNDPGAPLKIAAKIKGGSVGTWGRVIMPRQSRMTDAEAKVLAEWVLSQPAPS